MSRIIVSFILVLSLVFCASGFAETAVQPAYITLVISDLNLNIDGTDYPAGDIAAAFGFHRDGTTTLVDAHLNYGDQRCFPIQLLFDTESRSLKLSLDGGVYAFDESALKSEMSDQFPDLTMLKDWWTALQTYFSENFDIPAPADCELERDGEMIPAIGIQLIIDADALAKLGYQAISTFPMPMVSEYLKEFSPDDINVSGSCTYDLAIAKDGSYMRYGIVSDTSVLSFDALIEGSLDSLNWLIAVDGNTVSFKTSLSDTPFEDTITGVEPAYTFATLDDLKSNSAVMFSDLFRMTDDANALLNDADLARFFEPFIYGESSGYDYEDMFCSREELPFILPVFFVPEGYEISSEQYCRYDSTRGSASLTYGNNGDQFGISVNNYSSYMPVICTLKDGRITPVDTGDSPAIYTNGTPNTNYYGWNKSGLSFELMDYLEVLSEEDIVAIIESTLVD